MYFQVCSNSTYPQHSGERYRTSGPLLLMEEGFPALFLCLWLLLLLKKDSEDLIDVFLL